MFRVLYELWPGLLPITLYVLWHFLIHKPSARRKGNEPRTLKQAPWWLLLFISAIVAVLCVIAVRLLHEPLKGNYTPAHLENGKLVPGEIRD